MTATQVDFLLSGFTDSSGNQLNAGKVYTYTAGTVSNKTTWSDVAKTTPLSNPIILDSQGKKQVFAEGLYKFVVKDSSDNTLYTLDNLTYGTAIVDSQGYTLVNETWTYASASTVTVPTGAASRFQVGDKVKFTNSTVKYFYIKTVADTLLTLTGGTDYTVANAAISGIYTSRDDLPYDFPTAFNYTPTVGTQAGTFTSVSIGVARFRLLGRKVAVLEIYLNGTQGASSSNYLTITLPFTASATSDQGFSVITQNGSAEATGYYIVRANTTSVEVYRSAAAQWTAGATRYVIGNLVYQID